MKKTVSLSKTLLVVGFILFSLKGLAADFEWSGVYTVEGNHVKNSELDGRGRELNYGLHHLSLRPKIVAGDGITIFGQFELLTNSTYQDSQLGQYLGDGVGDASPSSADDSNTLSSHQKSSPMLISQLYLSWVHEYGALVVGRAPLQFGLGMNYNAGKNLFDHWFDTRDLVGYKIMMGNLSILPMYGKVAEISPNTNEDVNDYMIQLQYENAETDLDMGIMYRVRKSSDAGSDAPMGADPSLGGAGATRVPTNYNEISVFALKDTERFRAGIEASFLSGKIGAATAGGDKVTMNGFGIATEFEFRPDSSKWSYGLKAGTATGDDPETTSRYEGYVFDRNYQVGLLLFNRPLGRQDVLRTGLHGGGPSAGAIDKPDVDAVSNTIYVSPSVDYKWADKFTINTRLVTGWLNTDPQAVGDVGGDLGYELDFGLSYMPRKGVMWVNEIGMLMPGSAFDFNNDEPSFAYGITSKAAISF
ncbi:MAG: hypothetical protein AB7N80_00260 [Bdellovibrionales bacterium]